MGARGISLGGMLDGGGLPLRGRHLDAVRDAGFDTVRLPVRWDDRLAVRPPYAVEPAWFARVDDAIRDAHARGLDVVLDVHRFDALSEDPDRHRPRLLALWDQIARRYAGVGRLAFELLNEPHEPMTAERWNALLPEALAVVRAVSPLRAVLVGPARWNVVDALPALVLPDDEHVHVTVHYYSPFRFTHQGAEWLGAAAGPPGTAWGTAAERARVRTDLERAAAWARARGRALVLGEFGTHDVAAPADRAHWTECVRTEAERLGIDWIAWDLATGFGVYDVARDAWRTPLRDALLGGAG